MSESKTVEPESSTQVEEQSEEVVVEPDVGDSVGLDGADEVMAEVSSLSENMSVSDYTAPRSNLNHGHHFEKHDVRQKFGVNDELIKEFFMYAPNDHAAVHEMLARKEEFIQSDTPVFSDTHDADSGRWAQIERTAGSAPVPDETHRDLAQHSE